VFEDERPQTIAFFSDQDAPVTVGLLIDSSGSMRHERDLVIAAAGTFVETSNPADEIFALAFGDDVRAVLPPTAPFTGDADVLRNALIRTVSSMGRTALHDAIAAGLDYLARGRHPRKALVVVSDGGDNASRTTFEQVVRMTQVSNTVIYTVALADPIERDANPRRLGQLAAASGGEAFRPHGVTRIADAFRDIARDIRHTYTIGYVPSNPARQGRFHRTAVIARAPDRRRLLVRTRQGYFVEE
jgi:VWFA-related protein